MLETNKDNPLKIMESSSIRLPNEGIILFSSFSFKLMEIAECTTLPRSQCPHNWLRTQVETMGERQSTTV
jgi:hypothetical protein